MVLLKLTARQAVEIYGIWNPQRLLSWKQLVSHNTLTWKKLRSTGLSVSDLYKLQPDPEPWIQNQLIGIEDITEMSTWNIHPIKQMRCTLSQLALLHWPAEVFIRTGVTYDDLVDVGLTIQSIPIFGFTLLNWSYIGLKRHHLELASELECIQVFGMKKAQVISSLNT
jgi:hypothetical protein